MPLLSASVTAGTVIPSSTSTRPCNLAGVLPSASFASAGRAFTASSAAAFVSAALAFKALSSSASCWLITPSLFASTNASSAAFSAASAAFTFSSALLTSTASSMPLLFASVTPGTSTGFTSFTRPCNESFVLVPSVAPSGSALTASSAAFLASTTFAFKSFSLSASSLLMI